MQMLIEGSLLKMMKQVTRHRKIKSQPAIVLISTIYKEYLENIKGKLTTRIRLLIIV